MLSFKRFGLMVTEEKIFEEFAFKKTKMSKKGNNSKMSEWIFMKICTQVDLNMLNNSNPLQKVAKPHHF